ncbi:MAG: hypothetical protein MUC74_15450 [Ideonella sp.]|jgi:hypothetical protein|nr:hypothetical protein [Ideonella sp.]
MSDDAWTIPLPPFKPADALVTTRRSLRDLKLAERGDGFEFKARRVVELTLADDHLVARVVRRPAMSPEWETRRLTSGADVRHFIDDVRRRLARWEQDD